MFAFFFRGIPFLSVSKLKIKMNSFKGKIKKVASPVLLLFNISRKFLKRSMHGGKGEKLKERIN